MNAKNILDPCCGSRMMYFDKQDKRVVFGDIRTLEQTFCAMGACCALSRTWRLTLGLCHTRTVHLSWLPLTRRTFIQQGLKAGLLQSTAKLSENWRDDLRKGFAECFRVLASDGVLVFKWNETQVKIKEVLLLTPHKPLFGHPTGRKGLTHWMVL